MVSRLFLFILLISYDSCSTFLVGHSVFNCAFLVASHLYVMTWEIFLFSFRAHHMMGMLDIDFFMTLVRLTVYWNEQLDSHAVLAYLDTQWKIKSVHPCKSNTWFD